MDLDPMRSTVGDRLRAFRVRAGLTQLQLAERAGLSVRTVRDIEQDRVARPRRPSLRQLADALDLAAADRAALLDPAVPAQPVTDVRVEVLGPLVVRRHDVPVERVPGMQRRLLALLAVQPGETVTVEEIIDVLWGERPPRSSQRLVHSYVAQLRDLLEPGRATRSPARVLPAVAGGYRLDLGAGQLDVPEFDEHLARGRLARAGGDADGARVEFALALDRWRGPVAADGDDRLRRHPAAMALAGRRVAAALAYGDLALDAARFDEAADRLRPLAAEEPLDEAIAARLILALAGRGQQAVALQLFETIRERLADELGVRPGAELRDAHLRVVRQQVGGAPEAAPAVRPPATARPAQLPAAVPAFTGREDELRRLDAELDPDRTEDALTVVLLTGTAGVGKTALAVHWGRRIRDRFPDGQLHVNLHGYAAGPALRPIEGLARFLHALGVPAEQVPTDLDEAAGLYRSTVGEQRLLIVLDNANAAEQVRPLLPASPRCLVLVTSRDNLGGLVARDGARRVRLDALPPADAQALLGRVVGTDAVDAEPVAAAELAELCAGLPLALRIAAANLDIGAGAEAAGGRRPIAAYAARLRTGNRLSDLAVDGDPDAAVRAAFDLSYRALPEPVRRMFRLLGLLPGPDLTAAPAAALAGTSPAEARRWLDRLVAAHLLDEPVPGRYAPHDLLRLYAAERVAVDEADPARLAAAARLYDHYLVSADLAAQLLYPQMLRLPMPAAVNPSGGPGARFVDQKGAAEWLDAERVNLLAAIAYTATHGPRQVAWLLADTLRGFFYMRSYYVDWLATARTALSIATAEGELRAQSAGLISLATMYWFQNDLASAIDSYEQALTVAERAGWLEAQGATHGNLGAVYRLSGQPRRAAEHLNRALDLNRRTGRLAGQAATLANLSTLCWELGRLAEAAEHGAQAVALFREIGSHNGEGLALGTLGEACHALGRYDEAIEHLNRAMTAHGDLRHDSAQAASRYLLAAVHRDLGRLDEARALAEAAYAYTQEVGELSTEATAATVLGSVHHLLGNRDRAVELHRRSQEIARRAGNQNSETEALLGLAQALPGPEAIPVAEAALAVARRCGYRLFEGQALHLLADAAFAAGDPAATVAFGEQALAVHAETGYRLGAGRTLLLLGQALAATGAGAAAQERWVAARDLLADLGVPEVGRAHGFLRAGAAR